MEHKKPFELRWGIISTGKIAASFAKDLLLDPSTRGTHDVIHRLVAVGSRSVQKAQHFVNAYANGDPSVKAYGSYEEIYADDEVDVVYIGTPHTHHYPNSMDAIRAGKHVLCEKPVTCNAAQLRSLLAEAEAQDVFFMEAMWTRFQPLSLEVKRIIDEGSLGMPITVHADFSWNFDIQNMPSTHRVLDPKLGGGGLLDLGPYPLVWAITALYEYSKNNRAKPTNIAGAMVKTSHTNVDCNTSFTVTWSSPEFSAQAILSCSINAAAHETAVIINFEHGAIKIPSPIFCPKEFIIQRFDQVMKEERRSYEYTGGGWHFQADEVARCLRNGKRESGLWGHDKSLLQMEIFDEVRRQGGYSLPCDVEKV
ncbi:hypothetical protein AX14_007378 [Amanita brunnescens Koide BX004]|nr:hypothetical protein AX14_007378 [Amanita brunnescens Koide BX004]